MLTATLGFPPALLCPIPMWRITKLHLLQWGRRDTVAGTTWVACPIILAGHVDSFSLVEVELEYKKVVLARYN